MSDLGIAGAGDPLFYRRRDSEDDQGDKPLSHPPRASRPPRSRSPSFGTQATIPDTVDPERKVTQNRIVKAFQALKATIKAHPARSAGVLFGIILLLLALIAIPLFFSGVGVIALPFLTIPLGGDVIFMLLSYGICAINLCRVRVSVDHVRKEVDRKQQELQQQFQPKMLALLASAQEQEKKQKLFLEKAREALSPLMEKLQEEGVQKGRNITVEEVRKMLEGALPPSKQGIEDGFSSTIRTSRDLTLPTVDLETQKQRLSLGKRIAERFTKAKFPTTLIYIAGIVTLLVLGAVLFCALFHVALPLIGIATIPLILGISSYGMTLLSQARTSDAIRKEKEDAKSVLVHLTTQLEAKQAELHEKEQIAQITEEQSRDIYTGWEKLSNQLTQQILAQSPDQQPALLKKWGEMRTEMESFAQALVTS